MRVLKGGYARGGDQLFSTERTKRNESFAAKDKLICMLRKTSQMQGWYNTRTGCLWKLRTS